MPAELPAFDGQVLNGLEMLVVGQDGDAMLHGDGRDPNVILRDRTSVPLELRTNLTVGSCRIGIRKENWNRRTQAFQALEVGVLAAGSIHAEEKLSQGGQRQEGFYAER